MNQQIQTISLDNGARMIVWERKDVVEHFGVIINAGSRDEDSRHHGLAHFVEHTIFKGTPSRRSWHILNRMEGVGGELNAYTTKEETVIYTVAPAGNVDRAMDLVCDIVSNSSFPERELAKEREVVADEIDSYLDTPSEGIFDDFEDLIFAGSSLGHNILGDSESLSTFTTDTCRGYLDRYYTPRHMVFFYSGPGAERAVRLARRYILPMNRPDLNRERATPAILPVFDEKRELSTHQAHTVMGCRVPGMLDDNRWGLALTTNILGGPGMNSRLNVALRERRGLVYTIDAGTTMLSDTGLFTIYFGCDHDDVARCRRLVGNVVDDLADRGLSVTNLEKARKQYIGQMTVASTSVEQRIISMARSILYRGHYLDREEILQRIHDVTPAQVMDIAAMIASPRLSVLTLG